MNRYFINYYPAPGCDADDDPRFHVDVWEAATGKVIWADRPYRSNLRDSRAAAAAWIREQLATTTEDSE